MKKTFKDFLVLLRTKTGYYLNSRYEVEVDTEDLHEEVYRCANSLSGKIAFDLFCSGHEDAPEIDVVADLAAYKLAYPVFEEEEI